jgi:putative SOS response-associated peptidase YedK
MCGRYAASQRAEDIAEVFGIRPEGVLERPEPSYNVAPTDPVPAVLRRLDDRSDDGRVLRLLRWGLVPWWAPDARGAARRINARIETVATRPAYRAALAARRCLLPADGYYEWTTGPDGGRQPFFLRPTEPGPLALAGLYERWRDPAGTSVYSCTILTTAASGTLAVLHDRMPMVVPPSNWDAWLDRSLVDVSEALSLPRSPSPLLTAHPVHPRVGNVRASGPELSAAVDGS